jgi:hypothetical protein
MTEICANRRDLLRGTTGLAGASLLGLFNISPALAAEMGKVTGRSEKPLKAAFSNIGLQVSWCAQGKQAAEYWGKLFNVDVAWFDGELPTPSSAPQSKTWRTRNGTSSPSSHSASTPWPRLSRN